MKATMKQIADLHGISVNAVSLALNNKPGVSDEMRSKILRTAEEIGYLENKDKFVRTFSRMNLCVMMQKKYSRDMNFYGRVLYAVVEEAKRNGYDILMNFFDDNNLEVPTMISDHRVAGIVIIGKINDENISKLQTYRIPIILVDHASLTKSVDSILTDNKLGGFIITKYLIDKGFKKIGFFGDLNYSLSIKERFFGFKEALDSFELNHGIVNMTLDEYIGKYSVTEDIEEAVLSNDINKMTECIKTIDQLPEVYICSNDKAAILLLSSLQSLGYHAPNDISVVGFDNIDMCEKINPKLTTVNVNKELMGKRAVQRLIYRISHRDVVSENAVISVDLVERDSVQMP
ncbi:LacI family transcriptional regulator [Mobilisporobacter senegalensis]|uniref:LacI family transcriptional regulator n=1 Tax=Mobilisporobacter senegalensis TaxID=1329262 RepID=A0A3N1X578_9FIRM|nr:LacI family DNA-binding transcriptional regulator [Mobilisporobacter senegalensis]ROR21221.1 LacI family transcriptional regulator [Mobilisporobacter senegalensis]